MKRLLIALILAVCALPLSAAPTELFFSEYIEGSSNNKALEIYNGTGAPVNLAANAYSIQMFFNGSSSPGLTINLTGTVAAGDVYVVAHSSANATILAQADQTSGGGWFNGDDAVVLRKGTTIIDVIGQIGFDPGSEWGTGLTSTADNTLRRKSTIDHGDASGGDVFNPAAEWDGFATDTFDGLGNLTPPPPAVTAAEIYQIQGSGLASPFASQKVRTENNIVTAVMRQGFFIQTPPSRSDNNPETSDGLYVFTGTAPTVAVGDEVTVEGTVSEFFKLTEMSASKITKTASGLRVPDAIELDETLPPHTPTAIPSLERFEGMLVHMNAATAAGPTNEFDETPVVAGNSRPFREPGITYPGVSGLPVFDGNPEIFVVATDPSFVPAVQAGGGAHFGTIAGPLSFGFGFYQVWPTTLEYSGGSPAPRAVRARATGEFTVGAQNMLRLFDTNDDPAISDDVPSAQRYADRLAKASLQIRNILGAPDVLSLEEVENIGVLQDLAAKIEADDASLRYTAYLVEGNDIGGIDAGFLVRDTVRVNAVRQIGADTVFAFDGHKLNDRPPLVLDADYVGNGAPFHFIAIAIHQRSLSGIDGSDGGRVRQKRLEQSVELATAIQQMQTADPALRIIALGDFNAFEFTDGYVDTIGIVKGDLDPLGAMLAPAQDYVEPNLKDRVLDVPASDRYSFVFDGSAQVLDHALTSAAWDKYFRAVQFSRGNSDMPVAFELDPTTPMRMSDHDGIVVFTMTDFDADGYPDDIDSCAHGDARPVIAIGDCDTGVPNTMFQGGCSIADKLAEIKSTSKNHGQYVSGVAHYTDDLMKQGLISGDQKGAIQACAGADNN